MASQMLEQINRRQAGAPPLILVDLGYVKEQATRDRANKIRGAGVGRKNFSLEGFNRLFVRLPERKAQAILERFPLIKEGTTYYQSTHNWLSDA